MDTCGGGGDVAAYALGALGPAESAAFEAHLAGCAICGAELASFQHVVDAMSLTSEPQHAPRALKRRVMRTVNQEARAERARRPQSSSFLRNAGIRPAWAGAGLLAAAAIAFGGVELAGTSGPVTHVYQAQVVAGKGRAQLNVTGTEAELAVQHFAVPSKGHTYEVWLLKRGSTKPVPAHALFDVTASGDGHVRLPVHVRQGDRIMVTQERAGGSNRPTSTPIMSVQLH